jgi:hypothetical protein
MPTLAVAAMRGYEFELGVSLSAAAARPTVPSCDQESHFKIRKALRKYQTRNLEKPMFF